MSIDVKVLCHCLSDEDLEKIGSKALAELNRRTYKRARDAEEKRKATKDQGI